MPPRVRNPSLPVVTGMVRATWPSIVTVIWWARDVDDRDHGLTDLEVDLLVLVAPHVRAGLHPGQVGGHRHLGACRPVLLGPVLDLRVGDPVPGALHVLGRA